MLYHVLNYNRRTGIAKVIDASLYGREDIAPSSWHISAFIDPRSKVDVIEGMTYSFVPSSMNIDGCFIRMELDYKHPMP